MTNQNQLLQKIHEKKAKVAVIGLGYVGLPLAILLARSGFRVEGYSRTMKKIVAINNGKSDIGYDNDLKKVLRSGKFYAYSITHENIQTNDIFIICVPTPVNKQKEPDLSSLKKVAKRLSQINLKNKLIINESTVAPFTTRRILGKIGKDYFLACSPERIDPGGDKKTENIPKVIGGINTESLTLALALYKQILNKETVPVNSLEIAEMAKMLENTYRAINIALANEFAQLADSLSIDILDVISAAKTKWSYQPHYPSIGVGGHCIPVDPYYLLAVAKHTRTEMKLVTEGLLMNGSMPEYVAQKIEKNYKPGMSVLVYGLTYKKNVADLRESPVLILCELLKKRNIPFSVYDPLLDKKTIARYNLRIAKLTKVDLFIVATDHKELKKDFPLAIGDKTIVIDGKNFFIRKVGAKVLGIGRSLL